MSDSKRHNKNVRVDLRNAFGSVPHATMWEMMQDLDVPDHFIHICQDIYQDSTQQIQSRHNLTGPILLRRGIKQGCPLSPLLFNLVLEGILPTLEAAEDGYAFLGGAKVSCLAYADDLCIVGREKEGIQSMLDSICKFFDWAGLEINPAKCGCLSMINNRGHKFVEPFQPTVGNGQPLPFLLWEETYRYLGVVVGRERRGKMEELFWEVYGMAEKILGSGLTDWQKVDAINTFVIPKAIFLLDISLLDQTWTSKMDAKLRAMVKKALHLPQRATNSFLHVAKGDGGLGMMSLEDMLHSSRVSRALLSVVSGDKRFQDVAWSQLSSVVKRRCGMKDISAKDLEKFLNDPSFSRGRASSDVRSIWSLLPKSLLHFACKVSIEGTSVSLHFGEKVIESHPENPVEAADQDSERCFQTAAASRQDRPGLVISPDQPEMVQQFLGENWLLCLLLTIGACCEPDSILFIAYKVCS